MCSEIYQFSSFVRTMSSSDKPKIFKEEDEREGIIEHGTSSQPMSENLGSSPQMVDHPKKEEEETDEATVSDSDRESEKQVSEDDDGFKTPTSSDHRIPAIMQCPPAPKKPHPPPPKLKRKASPPPGACRSLQFDASTTEIESIFQPISNDQDDIIQDQKMKRARTDDKDPS